MSQVTPPQTARRRTMLLALRDRSRDSPRSSVRNGSPETAPRAVGRAGVRDRDRETVRVAVRDRSRDESQPASRDRVRWQKLVRAIDVPEAQRSNILNQANAVQRAAGCREIGTEQDATSCVVACKGCERAMKTKFNPFCCGACRNITSFWMEQGLMQEANKLPPSVQNRHGPHCSEGQLYVCTWRAQGRPSR